MPMHSQVDYYKTMSLFDAYHSLMGIVSKEYNSFYNDKAGSVDLDVMFEDFLDKYLPLKNARWCNYVTFEILSGRLNAFRSLDDYSVQIYNRKSFIDFMDNIVLFTFKSHYGIECDFDKWLNNLSKEDIFTIAVDKKGNVLRGADDIFKKDSDKTRLANAISEEYDIYAYFLVYHLNSKARGLTLGMRDGELERFKLMVRTQIERGNNISF